MDSFIVSSEDTTDWDSDALTQTGTYRLAAEPARIGTGTLALTLSRPVDVGRLSSTGDAAVATVSRPGQDAEVTFNATTGDDLSLGITENAFTSSFSLTVVAPSGAEVVGSATVSAARARTQGLPDLPETGTYTVIMDPRDGAQGSAKLTLSADLAVDVDVDGDSVPVTVKCGHLRTDHRCPQLVAAQGRLQPHHQ
ncbi:MULTISPECIES: hypothetical protein [unclassified Streptomyces]|uniref:hypothetical protein n=1 Tax=unclassified Streptomyces TaxID=2593676 RepID=UPI002349C957|nr:hypothetical protein [Streptomyces sp. M92]WCN02341.1 hypothetical protein M6G08_09770 [Streptomyces sp. M92]